jgi:hypothetical protein
MDTDNMLETLICNEFTSEEQQLFVNNFKLYLQYGLDNKEFVISIDDVCEWLEFSRKSHLKRLLIKYFIENTDYSVENLLPIDGQQHGGHNKEKIMTTVSTFKSLCMLRDTDKGRRTRMYYTKMEEIFFTYMNIQHKNTIDKITKAAEDKLMVGRHNHLKSVFKEQPCVYIAKVMISDLNDDIVKLGESDDIEDRVKSLTSEYGVVTLLEVYPCACPHKFEQYLLKHHHIAPRRLPKKELIKLDNEFTIDNLNNIIKSNINFFNKQSKDLTNITQLKYNETLSKERMFVMQQLSACNDEQMKQVWIQQLEILNETCKPIEETNEVIPEEDIISIEKNIVPELKRRVYKYSPDDLSNPIEEFNSLKEAARSLSNHKIQDYHIRQAAVNNTIFADYRWYYVDNDDKPDTISETNTNICKPTKRNGLIAKLNKEKDKILDVFVNQREAAAKTNVAPCSITSALTKNKVCGGFYWICLDECSQELKETFEGELPANKQPSTCSKSVIQMKPDGEVVETFQCLQDACAKFGTCHKTIQKYSETGNLYKGYKWRIE